MWCQKKPKRMNMWWGRYDWLAIYYTFSAAVGGTEMDWLSGKIKYKKQSMLPGLWGKKKKGQKHMQVLAFLLIKYPWKKRI